MMSTMRHTLDAIRTVNVTAPVGSPESRFCTIGRSEVHWEPNGPIMKLVASFVAPSASAAQDMAIEKFEDLQQRLGEFGVDLRDIRMLDVTGKPEGDAHAASVPAAVVVRNPADKRKIDEMAIGAGFRLNRDEPIETVSQEDANREACARAIDDAVENLEATASRLGIPSDTIAMTDVKVETVEVPPGSPFVVRRAEIGWRRQ